MAVLNTPAISEVLESHGLQQPVLNIFWIEEILLITI